MDETIREKTELLAKYQKKLDVLQQASVSAKNVHELLQICTLMMKLLPTLKPHMDPLWFKKIVRILRQSQNTYVQHLRELRSEVGRNNNASQSERQPGDVQPTHPAPDRRTRWDVKPTDDQSSPRSFCYQRLNPYSLQLVPASNSTGSERNGGVNAQQTSDTTAVREKDQDSGGGGGDDSGGARGGGSNDTKGNDGDPQPSHGDDDDIDDDGEEKKSVPDPGNDVGYSHGQDDDDGDDDEEQLPWVWGFYDRDRNDGAAVYQTRCPELKIGEKFIVKVKNHYQPSITTEHHFTCTQELYGQPFTFADSRGESGGGTCGASNATNKRGGSNDNNEDDKREQDSGDHGGGGNGGGNDSERDGGAIHGQKHQVMGQTTKEKGIFRCFLPTGLQPGDMFEVLIGPGTVFNVEFPDDRGAGEIHEFSLLNPEDYELLADFNNGPKRVSKSDDESSEDGHEASVSSEERLENYNKTVVHDPLDVLGLGLDYHIREHGFSNNTGKLKFEISILTTKKRLCNVSYEDVKKFLPDMLADYLWKSWKDFDPDNSYHREIISWAGHHQKIQELGPWQPLVSAMAPSIERKCVGGHALSVCQINDKHCRTKLEQIEYHYDLQGEMQFPDDPELARKEDWGERITVMATYDGVWANKDKGGGKVVDPKDKTRPVPQIVVRMYKKENLEKVAEFLTSAAEGLEKQFLNGTEKEEVTQPSGSVNVVSVYEGKEHIKLLFKEGPPKKKRKNDLTIDPTELSIKKRSKKGGGDGNNGRKKQRKN